MAKLQTAFISRASELVKESVATKLESELTQLKEDIHTARENMFGRRLFEAFASEFAVTHLNENKEVRKLQDAVKQTQQELAEAKKQAEENSVLVESKEKEIRIIKESAERKQMLESMLKPLNKEKAAIMSDLLESVQTAKLQTAYEKYLPYMVNTLPLPLT